MRGGDALLPPSRPRREAFPRIDSPGRIADRSPSGRTGAADGPRAGAHQGCVRGRGRGPAGRPGGRPGAGTTARPAPRGRPGRRCARRRRRCAAAPRRRRRWPITAPRPASSASRGRRARSPAASTTRSTLPGLQSVASATVDAGVEQSAGVRVGRAGGELDRRQQRGHRRRPREGVDVGRGQVGAVVDARRPELDRQPHAGAGGRAGCRARAARGPAAARRSSTARDSSSSKACALARRTRRPSGHVRRARAAASVRSPARRSRGAVGVPGGTTWAPRKVTSAVTSAASRSRGAPRARRPGRTRS